MADAGRKICQGGSRRFFAAVVVGLVLLGPNMATAQQQPKRQDNVIQRLFFGGVAPAYQERRDPPARAAPRTRPRQQVVRSRPAEPPVQIVEKKADAKVVLVVGDFLAASLAEGMQDAYAQASDLRVVARPNKASGLVRPDFYDWIAAIGPMLDEVRPAALVVMIGANDRQQILAGNARLKPGTEAWNREYAARAVAFAAQVWQRRVPLLWVGMPSFRQSSLSADILKVNGILRDVAGLAGAGFVDIWDGFVDEAGQFSLSGPDIAGTVVALRSVDGVNLTAAGRRKAAFYVEKPLNRILGRTAAPAPPAGRAPAPDEPAEPPMAERTPPMALTAAAPPGPAELLGGEPGNTTPKPRTAAERLAAEGLAAEPPAGRADNFTAGQTVQPGQTTPVPR